MSRVQAEAERRWDEDFEVAENAMRLLRFYDLIETHMPDDSEFFWDIAAAWIHPYLKDSGLLQKYELESFSHKTLAQVEADAIQDFCDHLTDEDMEGEHKYEQQRDRELMEGK